MSLTIVIGAVLLAAFGLVRITKDLARVADVLDLVEHKED